MNEGQGCRRERLYGIQCGEPIRFVLDRDKSMGPERKAKIEIYARIHANI